MPAYSIEFLYWLLSLRSCYCHASNVADVILTMHQYPNYHLHHAEPVMWIYGTISIFVLMQSRLYVLVFGCIDIVTS